MKDFSLSVAAACTVKGSNKIASVIPAQAGIQQDEHPAKRTKPVGGSNRLDSRLRGNDDRGLLDIFVILNAMAR